MGRRGRKSTEELVALPAPIPQRPDPPARLDERGRERWVEILNELPVDRFRASDLVMLADMILAEKQVHDCQDLIATHGLIIGSGKYREPKENPALKIRDSALRTIVMLQRALRMCPSMRTRQDSAGLQKTNPGGKKKLWDE